MNKNLFFTLAFALTALLSLPGCYTQLQSARDRDYDDDDSREYSTAAHQDDSIPAYSDTTYQGGGGQYDGDGTTINNYYGDSWHPWVGYSYYPRPSWSVAGYFDAVYNDPYYGWGYSYGWPGYCYTCYPAYYPYSAWYYSPGYYYPYYGGYGYAGNGGAYRRTSRNIGSTRGGESRRPMSAPVDGGTGGYAPVGRVGVSGSTDDLPRAGYRGGASTGATPSGTSATPARREGSRSGSTGSNRGTVSSPRPGGGSSSGRGGSSRPSGGTRSRGESGRSAAPAPAPSYTPPSHGSAPASAPAPAPSSGGSSRGSGRRP